MPRGRRETFDAFSPKIAEKRKRRRQVANSTPPTPPPTVDNYAVNKPRVARSLNIQPVQDKPLHVSPNEGMPAVNSKSGKKLVEKAVTKVQPKKPAINPADAAIKEPVVKKKKTTKKKARGRQKKNEG